MSKFQNELSSSPLISENHNTKTVDELTTLYNKTLQTLFDKHAPIKEKKIIIKPNAPWYNITLKQLKKTKRYFEIKWQNTQSNEAFNTFKYIRNQYINQCNKSKSDYSKN